MEVKKTRKSRYYKTPYNESLKIKDSFTVPETQEFVNMLYADCDAFVTTRAESQRNGYRRAIGNYILSLSLDFDVKTIDSAYLINYYNTTETIPLYRNPFFKSLIHSFMLMNNKCHWNTQMEELGALFLPILDDAQNLHQLVLPLLSGEKNYKYCRYFRCKPASNKNEIISLIEFDTDNLFIQDLLLEFLNEFETLPRIYHMLFIKQFAESLNDNLPDTVYGFTIETLRNQEEFFINLHRDAEFMNRMFYRFVLEKKQGINKSITAKNGVNIVYLMSENFAKTFLNGHKLVLYNPNEEYPVFDRWAVIPNGLDQQTASDKPNTIKYIDFGRISDTRIRNAAKNWFWSEAKAGFENRYRNILYIIEFFEHRDNLRKMYFAKFVQARAGEDLDIKNTILAEEIIMYTSEWEPKLTKQSYISRMSPLKLFLEYMNENNIYKTELAAFEYLIVRSSGHTVVKEILPVPKDEFKKLIDILESKAKDHNLHMLYYIIFCLNTLTPLRISSILDLDYKCITEKSKGIYAVNVKVKTSDGDEKEIQISREVKRLIEVAVSLTADVRAKAPDAVKHYLFLVNNQKNTFKSIPHRSYNKHLQNCCAAVGIPLYSANNLRKTYYTNLVENAIKNNVSLLNLKELTGHASIDTTENHYVKENIRNYLEATMGVEIGNMSIPGEVVNVYPEANHDDLVNDECGYCRNPECNVLGTANCLMCKGFITTPDHIPQFEEAIAVLSIQLTENNNQHDKEHLYAVKRLYVAYLEQLYIRKEKMISVENDE